MMDRLSTLYKPSWRTPCLGLIDRLIDRVLMLTLKQTDVGIEQKARVDSLCHILGQT